MLVSSAKYKDSKCFKNHYAGFDEFKSINLVIGKNNSGKSRLIDFVKVLCGDNLCPDNQLSGCFSSVFTTEALQRQFRDEEGGVLTGHHWQDHGELLVGKKVDWTLKNGVVDSIEIDDYPASVSNAVENERKRRIQTILSSAKPKFREKTFKRLQADRDLSLIHI